MRTPFQSKLAENRYGGFVVYNDDFKRFYVGWTLGSGRVVQGQSRYEGRLCPMIKIQSDAGSIANDARRQLFYGRTTVIEMMTVKDVR